MREELPLFTALVDCPAGDSAALSDTVESLLAQTYRNVEVTLCGLPRDARAAEHSQLERWTVLGYGLRGLVWCPLAAAVRPGLGGAPGCTSPAVRGDVVVRVPAGQVLRPDHFATLARSWSRLHPEAS